MFSLSLALIFLASPLQSPPDDLPGVIVSPGNEVPEPSGKPKPPEPFTQHLPFAQFSGYEPALKALDADPLLARKISLHETHFPLRRLLAKVSDKQTVLQVHGDIAELRMQIALNNRPLSVLMRSLARMLPGTWKKEDDGKTYILFQTAAAQKYRREWWGLWQEESQRARKELPKYTLAFLKADPNKVSEYNPVVHTNDASIFVKERSDRGILRQLPNDVHERIAAQFNDYTIYGGMYGGEKVEGAVILLYSTLPNECKDALDRKYAQWFAQNAPSGDDVAVRLQNLGTSITMNLTTGKERNPASFSVDMRRWEMTQTLSPKHMRLKDYVDWLGDKAPPLWKLLDKFAAAKVWKNPAIKQPFPRWFQAFLPTALDTFAKEQNVEFIAECPMMASEFRFPKGAVVYNYTKPAQVPKDFAVVLPVLADFNDKSWRKTDEGVYLIRGNRWYRQDAAVIPEAKLAQWQKTLEANKVKRGEVYAPQTPLEVRQLLDLDSEIATTLTKWQIAEGLRMYSVEIPVDPDKPNSETRWLHPFGRRLQTI